ncbi:ATP-binding protein [Agromyces sp. G08B096]|uniref:ATP-binding protein n=1 Tax=Agromyces sp. G08B096 TaxID=3156399 RepID=A0AAU7WB45_9MICO
MTGPAPAVELLRRRIASAGDGRPGGSRVVVAIDGPSGSGKSTFADALVRGCPAPVDLVRLDDVYPGWHGLERGAQLAAHGLVEPWLHGRAGRAASWDWAHSQPGAARPVRPGRALVVEGCGAFDAVARIGGRPRRGAAAAVLRVWVEASDAVRKRAALDRDAGGFDPWWDVWDAQWRRYAARTRARSAADLVVRTSFRPSATLARGDAAGTTVEA